MRRSVFKCFYQYLAKKYPGDELLFMNYGFADSNSDKKKIALDDSFEKYRYHIQLYHHVVNSISLKGKDVLEVGCGRGGGPYFIMKYFNPRSLVGIDLSKKTIALCNSNLSMNGLSFFPGDAELIPFKERTFDAVVNIESSTYYPNMERFLNEVYRVLRLNGYFLFADYRLKERMVLLNEKIRNSGLELLEKEIITDNVVKALDLDHERKVKIIHQKAPKLLHGTLQSLTGVKGSYIHNKYKTREIEYFRFVLQKQE